MDKETMDLLNTLPPGTEAYACGLTDLDMADVPQERIPKLKKQLKNNGEHIALTAARILCCWSDEDGFEFLRSFVCDSAPLNANWMPHRLRNYDDTYKHILDAFVSYWAKKSDVGLGDLARDKIFDPVIRIVEYSNQQAFEIRHLFWLVEEKGFTEYLPALKEHLTEILKSPEFHHWKVADCAHLLMKFDPDFVQQVLAAHGKTLADYPNK